MSELELLRSYQDRQAAEFRQWLAQPAPQPASADNPRVTAGSEHLGPPAPGPRSVWTSFYETLAAGFSTAKDVAASGVSNIAGGARGGQTKTDLKTPARALGQQALGVMELLSSVPAGVGAAVQKAMQEFTPGMEATPIPGLGGRRDPNDPPSVASYLRTLLALPQILLDPKMAGFSWPELSRAMDDPITYGEVFNIAAAFAAGPPVARAMGAGLGRMRGRGAVAPETPEMPMPASSRGPVAALTPAEAVGRFTQMAPDAELEALPKPPKKS